MTFMMTQDWTVQPIHRTAASAASQDVFMYGKPLEAHVPAIANVGLVVGWLLFRCTLLYKKVQLDSHDLHYSLIYFLSKWYIKNKVT
jgi:hypothetical protein